MVRIEPLEDRLHEDREGLQAETAAVHLRETDRAQVIVQHAVAENDQVAMHRHIVLRVGLTIRAAHSWA